MTEIAQVDEALEAFKQYLYELEQAVQRQVDRMLLPLGQRAGL